MFFHTNFISEQTTSCLLIESMNHKDLNKYQKSLHLLLMTNSEQDKYIKKSMASLICFMFMFHSHSKQSAFLIISAYT